ncbi:hypothetical protein SORBI_3005G144450 [Sorghum bicolor]|uniref:Uncharacterized protein n=1 Tax=Sorghum bicolor TaxID=4558 RepID=A0A1Z5RJ35_SORBI|nr:hypothetical protein SORBI_3005G144450 [Sorghum bicolor]
MRIGVAEPRGGQLRMSAAAAWPPSFPCSGGSAVQHSVAPAGTAGGRRCGLLSPVHRCGFLWSGPHLFAMAPNDKGTRNMSEKEFKIWAYGFLESVLSNMIFLGYSEGNSHGAG